MDKKMIKKFNGYLRNSIIGVVIIVILVAAIGVLLHMDTIKQREYINELEKEALRLEQLDEEDAVTDEEDQRYAEIEEAEIRIVCWGDDLSDKNGEFSFTDELQRMLTDKGNDAKVVNMNVAGEDTRSVMVRSGALAMLIDDEFVIPEDRIEVEVKFHIADGKEIPFLKGGKKTSTVRIGDIWGTLSYNEESDKYMFKRRTAGGKSNVLPGTQIITRESEQFRDYFPIIAVGMNGGWNDAYELIQQQQAILDSCTYNQGNFLMLGVTQCNGSATEEALKELESIMLNQWGGHYMNVRTYLSEEGVLTSSGVELSEQDNLNIEAGIVPSCVKIDGVNLNDAGSKIMGQLIYYTLQKQGVVI